MRIHKPHLFDAPHGEHAAEAEQPEDDDAPLPGYDRIKETELVADLHHHSQVELEEIETWERSHQSRTRVLNKLHYLRQREPLSNYDELSTEEVEAALKDADLATIDNIRAYERKFGDRPAVLDAISEIRPRVAEMQPSHEGYRHTSYGPSVSTHGARAPRPGQLSANKALVTRLYSEVINSRDLDAIDRLLSEEFIHNGRTRHRTDQRQEFAQLLEAFPDLRTEIELILAEADLIAVHQRWTGTHQGTVSGVEQGQHLEFTSTAVIRIRDGRITEAWDEVDLEGLTDLFSDGG